MMVLVEIVRSYALTSPQGLSYDISIFYIYMHISDIWKEKHPAYHSYSHTSLFNYQGQPWLHGEMTWEES